MAAAKNEARSDAGRIADARGRRVTLLDPYMLWLARRHDIIPADVLGPMAREIGFGLVRGQRALFWVSVVCAGLVLMGIGERIADMVLHGTFSWRGLSRTVGLFNTVWVGPLIFWVGARLIRLQRTIGTMLKHLRCPHCGYYIRLLPADPVDGATVCPECGCAWKLDDSGTAARNGDGTHPPPGRSSTLNVGDDGRD